MSVVETLFGTIGGLGLFLYGMGLLSYGLKRIAADGLRRTIALDAQSPLGVTAATLLRALGMPASSPSP